MRGILIANPTAGTRRPEAAPELIAERLNAEGLPVALCCTEKRGDAEQIARESASSGVERVVVAGGDGTLNEVANGLLGSGLPVAIIPCGTANVLANELDLPWDVGQACRIAAKGTVRPIDLGICNGRAFFLAAGTGLDAALVRAVPANLKRSLGKVAYWLTAGRVLLTARPARFCLRIDGESRTESLYGAIVCGTRFYAGRYRIAPDARPDDGLLDLVVIRCCGRLNLLRAGLALVRGRAASCPTLESCQVRIVECEAMPPMPVQLDGDDFCYSPVEIHVVPAALNVITAA